MWNYMCMGACVSVCVLWFGVITKITPDCHNHLIANKSASD